MTEHVVIKNLKHDIKLALDAPVRATPVVTVDANTLKWFVEQYERNEILLEWVHGISVRMNYDSVVYYLDEHRDGKNL